MSTLAGWNMARQPTPQRHSRLMSLENLLLGLKGGGGRTPLATQQFQLGRIINTNIFNSWWECQDLTRHVKTARQNNMPRFKLREERRKYNNEICREQQKSSSKRPSCWWHCLIFMNKLRNTLEPSLKKRAQSRVESFCFQLPPKGIHHAAAVHRLGDAKRKVISRIGWV